MKTRTILILAAIAIPLVSCNKDKVDPTPAGPDYQEITFKAKAAAIEGVDLGFKTGDALSVFDGKANQKFTATSATEFKGTANAKAEAFYALYPYNAEYKRTSGKVSVTIPSAQAPEAGKVAAGANYQVAYATSATEELKFTFVPALLKLNVATDKTIVSITVQADGEEALTGSCNVELSATPKCEKLSDGLGKVTITGSDIKGAYYASVFPGKVSGFTVSFTASDDFHAEVKVAGAELTSGAVADLGTFNSLSWVEPVNPNPTNVAGAVLMKASFDVADFNMVGDGGFEDYPRDTWKWPNDNVEATLIDGHNSPKALRMVRLRNDGGMTNLEQGMVWTKVQAEGDIKWIMEFDARVSKDSNVDFYSGFGFFDLGGNWWKEVNGHPGSPADVVENGRFFHNDEQWHHYVLEDTNYPTQCWGTAHVGMWGNPDVNPCWSEYDNVIAYPKGYDIKGTSTEPKSATVLGAITNATYDQVDGLGRVVAWMDTDGKVKFAFSDVVINGTTVPTAIAETQSTDPTSIQISKFLKSEGTFSEIIPVEGDATSVVPDDVFILGGKTYLHYYGMYELDPNFTLNWKTDKSGFAVSEDNGKTWTAAPNTWAASVWANNNDGKFSNATFVNHDGYTYMIGSHAGRDNWLWGKSYAGRVADGKDLTDPKAYEYYANPGWTDGATDGEWAISHVEHILQGDRGTYEIIWNPKFELYQLFYRADAAQGVVYRDSKGPDAEGHWLWSGPKLLTKDEDTGVIGAISVLKVEDDGSVIFVGSLI